VVSSPGRADLARDIRALGIGPGDSLIVHTAFRRVGPVAGGVRTLIDALVDVVLPSGALLFPNLHIPHGFTAVVPPRFDVRTGNIRNLGIVPTIFKSEYAECFSLHPTHALMGIGDRAFSLLKGHELAGCCCGAGTPWERNGVECGKVLLIGCDQRCNTTYHTAEELVEQPYRLTEEMIEGFVVLDGREMIVPSRLHVWDYSVDFNVLNPELERAGHLRCGRIGQALALCLDAGPFIALALEKLVADRWYFLTDPPPSARDLREDACAR
jgi:aminoglycoside 3-N-acetyltransferase